MAPASGPNRVELQSSRSGHLGGVSQRWGSYPRLTQPAETTHIRPSLGRRVADGADVVDYLTEIPLSGRAFATAQAGAAPIAMPAFVAGPENRLVAETVSRLLEAASPAAGYFAGGLQYTPGVVAFFGASGTGKTHLIRGLVRHWEQQRGADSACYLTASDFRRRFAAAIDQQDVREFHQHVRSRQLLAIDDLHHLPSSESLWRELRYLLDDYEDRGESIVVAASRPVSILANLPPDICSRFAAGLTLQLSPPGSDARLRIVRHASTALNRAVSDDVAQRLVAGVFGTTTDLFAALFELCASASKHATCDAVGVERFLAARGARRPTVREIIALVARHHGVSQKQLKSHSRKQSAVRARSVAAYLARELAAASYDQIGRALGGRDHTTILHSYRKIDRQRQCDATTQELLDELRRTLLNRLAKAVDNVSAVSRP